jgi:hypothetical protein
MQTAARSRVIPHLKSENQPTPSTAERFRRRELILCDSSISPKARIVFLLLDEVAREKGTAFPSQRTLADKTGFSERSVQRALAELRKAGSISVSRRREEHGPNEYSLVSLPPSLPPKSDSLPPKLVPLPPAVAGALPPSVSGVAVLSLVNNKSLLNNEELSGSEFRELEDGFDRHLKHHRTEDRDNVLRILMDQAQRGDFDWFRFRARHLAWCERQRELGWQYATLTFLGWVRAGMPPPAPPAASGHHEGATQRAIRVAKERIQRTGRL